MEQNAIHMVVVQMGWRLISLNPIIFNTWLIMIFFEVYYYF
jgi:hypothetical protein